MTLLTSRWHLTAVPLFAVGFAMTGCGECYDCGPCAWAPYYDLDTVAVGAAGLDPQGNPTVELHYYPAGTCGGETHDRYLMRWIGGHAELDLDFGTQLDTTRVDVADNNDLLEDAIFHWKSGELDTFVHRVSDAVLQIDWQTPDATTTYQCELVGDTITCEAI